MFIKFVIILLLLIVVASLLTGRNTATRTPASGRIRQPLRVLMLRVAVILLILGAAVVVLHAYG